MILNLHLFQLDQLGQLFQLGLEVPEKKKLNYPEQFMK